jgi:hypothetical protein
MFILRKQDQSWIGLNIVQSNIINNKWILYAITDDIVITTIIIPLECTLDESIDGILPSVQNPLVINNIGLNYIQAYSWLILLPKNKHVSPYSVYRIVDRCLSFSPVFYGHCVVCPLIYVLLIIPLISSNLC